VLAGIGLPLFVFFVGDVIESFEPQGTTPPYYDKDETMRQLREIAIRFALIGVYMQFASYLYYSFLALYAESVEAKIRVAYFKALITQDIAWYDSAKPAELSSRLDQECLAMKRAIGEKQGTIIFSLAMGAFGIAFSFVKGWIFTFILIGAFPLIFGASYFTTKALQKGFKDSMKAYSQSAGYAEQALNAIKVVQAFGREDTEQANYEKYLGKARKSGLRTHLKSSLAIAMFFTIIFAYYAYSFYTASWLITEEVENSSEQPESVYDAGDIMSCFFGVVFALFSIGMAFPNVKAVGEGRVAAKCAFDIMEQEQSIKLDEEGKAQIQVEGKIEFRDVGFKYPTRPD